MPPTTLDVRGPSSFALSGEANMSAPTPNHYWRLFNDQGFSPPTVNLGPPVITTEAFLSLTHQVQQRHLLTEVRLRTPSITAAQLGSHPRGSTPMPPELDTLSFDSTDSLKARLPQVNQRLNDVQKEFVKSKEELEESSKGGSPFVPEIQDKPIPTTLVSLTTTART
ncbi:hypothetical protein BHE74_00045008 [Ensete ventricosum]|nr:hypothetical protein GW17_00046127 [Ensete ventricosum]RWW48886.1 hypothetical protein BHE74_00045008 [Ensete ventricosum]